MQPARLSLPALLLAGVLAADAAAQAGPLAPVEKMLQDAAAGKQIAGGVALVSRKGKVLVDAAVGLRDIEANKPMTRDTIFRIASMTKPVTSVAAMMLVEEGKLGL